jgi:hypothetical protein
VGYRLRREKTNGTAIPAAATGGGTLGPDSAI